MSYPRVKKPLHRPGGPDTLGLILSRQSSEPDNLTVLLAFALVIGAPVLLICAPADLLIRLVAWGVALPFLALFVFGIVGAVLGLLSSGKS